MANTTDRFNSANTITISIAHFIHDVYAAFLAPILPLIIDKLSINYSLVGLLKVIQTIPSLLNPFIGLIADRLKLRYLLIITPAVTTIVMSLIGLAPSYTVLAIMIFVAGLSSAFFHVPGPVLIKKVAGKSLGKGMSYFMVGGEIARTLGPLVILAAVSLWGLKGTYRLIPFGLLTTVYLFYKFRKINISGSIKKESNALQTLKNYVPFFIVLGGLMLFRASMKSALTFYLPTYMNQSGHSLWYSGIALSIIQLAGTAGTFIAGPISDKIGRKTSLLIISIITPLLMLAFIYSNESLSLPILIIAGIFLFGSSPVILAMVHDIKTDRPAFVNSLYMAINFLIGSIGVMVIGFLADKYGFQITYKISAYLAFGSIPFVLLLKTNKKSIN